MEKKEIKNRFFFQFLFNLLSFLASFVFSKIKTEKNVKSLLNEVKIMKDFFHRICRWPSGENIWHLGLIGCRHGECVEKKVSRFFDFLFSFKTFPYFTIIESKIVFAIWWVWRDFSRLIITRIFSITTFLFRFK